MLSNAEIMMSVVHRAQVHQATAQSEHRFAARLASRSHDLEARGEGWKVFKRLGSARARKAS